MKRRNDISLNTEEAQSRKCVFSVYDWIKPRGIPVSGWWIAAMCILVLPALLVLGPLG